MNDSLANRTIMKMLWKKEQSTSMWH